MNLSKPNASLRFFGNTATKYMLPHKEMFYFWYEIIFWRSSSYFRVLPETELQSSSVFTAQRKSIAN